MKDDSVVYLDRIVAFKALYRWTSIKGGAHTHFVDSLAIHASMKCVWAPLLTEVQRYGTAMWSEIRDGILFDLYTGLSQLQPLFHVSKRQQFIMITIHSMGMG